MHTRPKTFRDKDICELKLSKIATCKILVFTQNNFNANLKQIVAITISYSSYFCQKSSKMWKWVNCIFFLFVEFSLWLQAIKGCGRKKPQQPKIIPPTLFRRRKFLDFANFCEIFHFSTFLLTWQNVNKEWETWFSLRFEIKLVSQQLSPARDEQVELCKFSMMALKKYYCTWNRCLLSLKPFLYLA